MTGIDVDLRDAGELTPVVAALAALAGSPSRLRGIGHLRGHETDRLVALSTEINKLGGDVTEKANGLRIRPRALHGGVVATYDDHRMAMAAAVLGLVVPGIEVADVATTSKTLPGFVGVWESMLTAGERGLGVTSRPGRPTRRRALDEDDVRVLQRGKSRRRTKDRPLYAKAEPGFVVAVDWGRFTVLVGDPSVPLAPGSEPVTVTAVKARDLGRKGVVVGDSVSLVGDMRGGLDSLARSCGSPTVERR